MALTADEVIIQQTNIYPRKRDTRYYSYQSNFGNHPPIFYDLKNIPYFIGQSNDIYWSKHRRKNKEYIYPNYFGSEAWFYIIKSFPWGMVLSTNKTEYWSKHRRINKEYFYPSFFMNIQFLSTNWSCNALSTDDTWVCS